jgi:hypothetical protein
VNGVADIPVGLCQCGCGEKTRPAPHTNRHRGWKKGEPLKFVHGHNARPSDSGWELDPTTGCWNWTRFISKEGYGRGGRDVGEAFAHRAAYRREHGPIPDRHVVHHKCHNRACVNPDHLELMEKEEHARLHRGLQGRQGPRASLTEEQVRELRRAPREYGVQTRFARAWKVSVKAVNQAMNGRTYAWVK